MSYFPKIFSVIPPCLRVSVARFALPSIVHAALLLAFLSIPAHAFADALKITIAAPPSLLDSPVARLAVEDAASLLRRMFPQGTVSVNGRGADVRLVLPEVPAAASPFASTAGRSRSPFAVSDASYRWRSGRQGAEIVVRLRASSPEGVANGLYGLLQERLEMRFHHPRESIIPVRTAWPLPTRFSFSGAPRFGKRGFHIHTLHPVELTEQLHDPTLPNAFGDVRAYIDWLARNGQNTFQFFLLRGIDRKSWPAHARRIVEYAHSRGVRCGVEISLAMLQQQAFQAVTLLRPYPSYTTQVDETLAWLFQAPWDFVTIEATMGEHLPFLDRLLPGVQRHLERRVAEHHGASVMYATHVIRAGGEEKVRTPLLPSSGILIHTVMCYSASEAKAPVYGNANQCFMLDAAREEVRRRETWYWPESSYWVSFDSSVPLLLLPYLESRRQDMETMAGIGLSGHLTFTSGWEWGYWLVDWSIARWSWRYADNGRERPTSPLSRLAELFPDPGLSRLWREALEMQEHYLKERELMRYMAALAPFSELPPPFARPFQPEPGFRYARLLDNAGEGEVEALLAGPVAELERYSAGMESLVGRLAARLDSLHRGGGEALVRRALTDELLRALRVTSLRAAHRALTIRAILAKREKERGNESERLLARAGEVRLKALALVGEQESHYRYPVTLIARKRPSLTAYPFGYLYPVSVLFFWEREEEQVRRGRFDALFMNLWDFRRTLGLESLLFR